MKGAQILERSRRGKRHRARQGEVSVLGGAPYGYRYIKKTDQTAAYYEVIEAEAAVVRLVYQRYTVDHLSIGAITRLLNEQGVPTAKRISRWERSTVWAILRNPAYKGTAYFGKTRAAPRQKITRSLRLRGGIISRNSASHERPREEWIAIPVPAIVSEATFALAEERLAQNKRFAPRRTIAPSVVQGLVACKKCGYALSRTSTRTSKRKIHYYRCLGSDAWRHLGGPVCDNRPVRQDLLDQVVWTEIIRLLEDPSLIQAKLDRRLAAARNADPTERREKALKREAIRLRKSMDRLLTAYQEDLITIDEFRERMPALRQREQATQAELQSLVDQEQERATYLRLAETLTGFLTRLRSSAETLDVEERQRIVRLLVKDVLVGDDTIVIRHSIPVPNDPPSNHEPPSPANGAGNPEIKSYLLRSGRDQSAFGEPVLALCLRHVDVADLSGDPVRVLCGRHCLSLQEHQDGGGLTLCVAGSFDDLQAGAASGEDENRLLQGCAPGKGTMPVSRLTSWGLPSEQGKRCGLVTFMSMASCLPSAEVP